MFSTMLYLAPVLLLCMSNAYMDIYPIVKNCTHDDHCDDFRMKCSPATNSCICARFYVWEPGSLQCNLNLTELKEWLRTLKEERDHREELDEEALSIFYHLGLSGILAITLGFLGAFICVFFFCFLKSSDYYQQDECKPLTQAEKTNPVSEGDAAACSTVVLDFD